MSYRILLCTIFVSVLMLAGCQEPQNVRMRFASAIPGHPEKIVGVDARQQVLVCDGRTQEVSQALGTSKAPVRQLRVSPDGAYVAIADETGHCCVWEIATGTPAFSVALSGGTREDGAIASASDGRHLLCGKLGSIELHALDGKSPIRRIPDREHDELYLGSEFEKSKEAWSQTRILSLDARPTGHLILVGTDRGAFEIDYLLCAIVWRTHAALRPNDAATLVRYGPDENRFTVQWSSGRLECYQDHSLIRSVQPGEGASRATIGTRFTAAEFSSEGAYLTLLATDGVFRVVRWSDGEVIASSSPGKMDLNGISLSPDGTTAWIASQGNVERFTRLALPKEMWRQSRGLD